jgi:hypothetical protein
MLVAEAVVGMILSVEADELIIRRKKPVGFEKNILASHGEYDELRTV